MPIQFTRKGRYEVWRDGQKISEHNQEREATEQIINHSSVYGDGDYEIKGYLVVARVVGSVNPQTGDTTPPTTPGSVSASATSATTGTVTWAASTDASGVAGYQIFLDGAPLSPTTTSLSYSLTGLSPSTQYAVTVVAFDAAGNNSVAGGPALFTTDANSAPVWSLGNQAYETGASVSISLDTVCTDADGDTITYSLVSGSLPSGLALSGARNETLSGTVDTVETAVFTLGASDGIASVQNVALTFTITAPDTVAPAAPTGLTVVSTTSSSINLDWADNAESDLASYDVYRSTVSESGPWGKRNGAPLTSSNYQDSGLNELTQYWYYVTATDNSDNESSASSVVNSTTTAASSDPWDLWGSRPVPSQFSALAWPTAPAAVNGVTANSISELNSLAVSGNIVTLTPGVYSGTINLVNPDVRLILTGSTITGGFFNTSAGDRIRIDGGHIISSGQNVFSGSDLYFNNVRMEASGFAFADSLFVINPNAQRIALINCSLVNNDPASGRVMYQYAIGGTTTSDLIIAGTELLAQNSTNPGQWAARINASSRTVIVDSRLEVVSPSQSGRYHADDNAVVSGYYSARNQILNGTWNNNPFSSTGFTAGSMTGVYFYDNDFYRNDTNGQLAFSTDNGGSVTTVRAEDNTHYTQQNSGVGNMQIDVVSVSDYSASNNVRSPYVTPPAFAYGSDQ